VASASDRALDYVWTASPRDRHRRQFLSAHRIAWPDLFLCSSAGADSPANQWTACCWKQRCSLLPRRQGPRAARSRGVHAQWEWFRIYFGPPVKILSGEPRWRPHGHGQCTTRTGRCRLDRLHVQQWPHGFHAFTAALTLVAELLVVWLLFFPRSRSSSPSASPSPLQIGSSSRRIMRFSITSYSHSACALPM